MQFGLGLRTSIMISAGRNTADVPSSILMDLEVCTSISYSLVDEFMLLLVICLINYSAGVNEIRQWLILPKKLTGLYHVFLFLQLSMMKVRVASPPDESE